MIVRCHHAQTNLDVEVERDGLRDIPRENGYRYLAFNDPHHGLGDSVSLQDE
jgi:hypothetical protein